MSQVKCSYVLKEAKKFISNPDNWCKLHEAYGEESDGSPFETSATSAYAAMWDSKGAIIRAAYNLSADEDTFINCCHILEQSDNMNMADLESWNDCATHETVMKAFEKAIEMAESEGV